VELHGRWRKDGETFVGAGPADGRTLGQAVEMVEDNPLFQGGRKQVLLRLSFSLKEAHQDCPASARTGLHLLAPESQSFVTAYALPTAARAQLIAAQARRGGCWRHSPWSLPLAVTHAPALKPRP
jgi:hypothetical protein